jgi:hypothetical protein
MYETVEDLRDARRRRVLYTIFAIGMGVSAIICAFLTFAVFTPGARQVRLGAESIFARAGTEPVDIAVRQLETSKLIPNRPTLSEDVIFVVRDQQHGFRAFLGTDPATGCFLSWRKAEKLFIDNCAQHSYGFTGRNTNQLTVGANLPANMVELPVTVQNGVLFVEDRILRRDIR